jgi:hypothetical protein
MHHNLSLDTFTTIIVGGDGIHVWVSGAREYEVDDIQSA